MKLTPSTYNVLMTGAGAPGAAGIIRCLTADATVQLTVADADEAAVGRHLHSSFYKIPSAADASFTEAVLALCKAQNIQYILPLVTKELLPLAEAAEAFQQSGIQVLTSSPSAIRIANNKGLCYQTLADAGIEMPRFFSVKTVEEFIHAAFELQHPQQPFCFKPAEANGSRGFRIVSDSINEADQLFNHKPYNTFITYAHTLKILSSGPIPPLVVSEYLPGTEYSVDCLCNRGEAVLVVPRTRTKMIGGISVQGQFVNNEAVISYCKAIIKKLGLHGNIGIQLRENEAGEPLLLEINPRVQGTIVAALGAGVNLPLLAVKQAAGERINASEHPVNWGLHFARYWQEVFW